MTTFTRITARWFWPIVLTAKLIVYGIVDDQPHLLFWHATRAQHATFYFVAAFFVALTIHRAPCRWLLNILGLITFVALVSIGGDLAVSLTPASMWNSAMSWLLIGVANLIAVLLRLSWPSSKKGMA